MMYADLSSALPEDDEIGAYNIAMDEQFHREYRFWRPV